MTTDTNISFILILFKYFYSDGLQDSTIFSLTLEFKAGPIGIAVSGPISDRNELGPSYLTHTTAPPQVTSLVPPYTF